MNKIYSLFVLFVLSLQLTFAHSATQSELKSQYTPDFKLVKLIQNLMLEKIRQHELMSKEEIIDDIIATAMMNPEYLQRLYGESATHLEEDLKLLTKDDILFVEKKRLQQVSRCENYLFLITRKVKPIESAIEMGDLMRKYPKYFWAPVPYTLEVTAVIAVDLLVSPFYLYNTLSSCFAK